MLTAYMDVSRGAEPVYVLAGYLANVSQWQEFGTKWKRMLSDYDVSVYSPADLDLTNEKGERIGRYKGWSDRHALSFQIRAAKIIKEHRRVAVGSGIVTRDFHLKLGWLRKEDGLPRLYYYCTIDFLHNVRQWIENNKVTQPIEYIFETGDDGYYEVEWVLSRIRKDPERRAFYNLESFTRKDKATTIQLQAAGIWAYESYKHIANQRLGSQKQPVRESWKALDRKYDRPYNRMWDRENLPILLETYKDLGGLIDESLERKDK